MLRDGIRSRPTGYPMRWDGVLQRATEYLLQRRKYAHGRQSTSAICASIVTADKVPDAAGWNTLSADRIPDTTGWNTLTAVRVLATTAKALSQPTGFYLGLLDHESRFFS